MAWSGGTFTRAGGSTNWADDRDASIEIEAGLHDTHDEDLATGINACLTKDGSNAATSDLNLGTNKLTNVGDPTNAQDAVTKAYLESQILDEDDFSSDSATAAPSQQSTAAYVASELSDALAVTTLDVLDPYSQEAVASVPHGLASMPENIVVYLECKTADGGFSPGDRVDFTRAGRIQWHVDAANFGIRTDGGPLNLLTKGAATSFGATWARWKVVAKLQVF